MRRRAARRGTRSTRLLRRSVAWALGGAAAALGAATLPSSAWAVLVPDGQNDSGTCFLNSGASCGQNSPPAPDLVSFFASHTDGDRNSAADDSLSALTSVNVDPAVPGAPLNLFGRPGSTDQDRINWYLDTDANGGTGGLFGAEFRVTLVGQGGNATPDSMFLNAWNGSTFADGPQIPFVPQPGVGFFWDVKLAALGVSRGASARNIGVVVTTTRSRQGNDFFTLDALPENGQALVDLPALPGPPATETGDVAASSPVALTVNGRVSPGGLTTSFKVQYGTTPALGRETAPQGAGAGDAPVVVSATIPGLAPATTYFYRVVAQNNFAEASGVVKSGRTAAVAPLASTTQPRPVNPRGATLTGTVDPKGQATMVFFEWGRTIKYGKMTPPRAVAPGSEAQAVSARLRGLRPNTRYSYRLVAESASGRVVGQNISFLTDELRRPDIIESDFPFSRSCVISCEVAAAPLRVQLRGGNSGRLLGPARRKEIRVVVRVRGPISATRRFRLSRRVRVAPLEGRAPVTLRFAITRNEAFGTLDRLFTGLRFTGGSSIEVRIVGRGRLGRLHRVIFTGGTGVRESICDLGPGSGRPAACRPRR